jgi:hypothetical protein
VTSCSHPMLRFLLKFYLNFYINTIPSLLFSFYLSIKLYFSINPLYFLSLSSQRFITYSLAFSFSLSIYLPNRLQILLKLRISIIISSLDLPSFNPLLLTTGLNPSRLSSFPSLSQLGSNKLVPVVWNKQYSTPLD